MVATHQHFIRCIKPNANKSPGIIDGAFVCRQLRYLGVHAVIEINQVGYPVKILHEDFVRKYRCLAFDTPKLLDPALPQSQVCLNLLEQGCVPKDGPDGWGSTRVVQIGKGKVFLKTDVISKLDVPRRAARAKAAVVVEAYARRRLARRIAHFGRSHALAIDGVRGVLDRPDKDSKVATIETRIADAGLVLDELILLHEQSMLPSRIAPLVRRCESRRDALEAELRGLAKGLMCEVEATASLTQVWASAHRPVHHRTTRRQLWWEIPTVCNAQVMLDASSSSKEDFLKLKAATSAALEVTQGLCDELRDTIKLANTTIEVAPRLQPVAARCS